MIVLSITSRNVWGLVHGVVGQMQAEADRLPVAFRRRADEQIRSVRVRRIRLTANEGGAVRPARVSERVTGDRVANLLFVHGEQKSSQLDATVNVRASKTPAKTRRVLAPC
jgi:hypothetical protein